MNYILADLVVVNTVKRVLRRSWLSLVQRIVFKYVNSRIGLYVAILHCLATLHAWWQDSWHTLPQHLPDIWIIVLYPNSARLNTRCALQSTTYIHAQCSTYGTVATVTAASPILQREAIPGKQFQLRGPAAQPITNHTFSYKSDCHKHTVFYAYLRFSTFWTNLVKTCI